MSSSSKSEVSQLSKACRTCALDIPMAAIKCSHCESYQDWRSGLGINATVLSMITALVATCISAIPIIKSATAKHQSHIYAQFSTGGGDSMSFILINDGDRPGVAYQMAVQPPKNLIDHEMHMMPVSGSGVLVKPGEAKEVSFMFLPFERKKSYSSKLATTQDCLVSVNQIRFDAQPDRTSFSMMCLKFSFAARPPTAETGHEKQPTT